MSTDTSNRNICKNIEYKTMYPWMADGYTIIIDDKDKKQREEIRELNNIINGRPDMPCQCPRCRTSVL